MTPLPQKLRKTGFDYAQIARGKRSAIYKQIVDEKTIAYEVFIIRIVPERCINGNWIGEHEKFPSNEAFGHSAWTCRSLDGAMERYNKIENIKDSE